MPDAFLCDAVRTPFGRYAGALSSIRTDDLGAIPIAELMRRNGSVDWQALDDVIYGCATRPARTTATWRAWRCSSRGSPSTCPPPP